METTFALLTAASAGVLAAAVWQYERMLARARYERDEAVNDCEMFSELLLEDAARRRHPSAQQYGGGNLRIVK